MKNILVYILIASSLVLTCCGQGDKKSAKEITAKDTVTAKTKFPIKPVGWVSDYDMLLNPTQVEFLDSVIADHEKETTNEIAVVTYQPDSTQLAKAGGFDQFATDLFNEWGVGKKDKNNGIGILISAKLRKIRIEVGKGLESKLTHEETKQIIDSIITPEFKNGAYYTGILNGLQAIFREIQ